MNSFSFFGRVLLASTLCLALATPALAAEAGTKAAAPAAKKESAAPAKSAPAPAVKKQSAAPAPAKKSQTPSKASAPAAKKAPGKSAASSPEAIQKGLETFADSTIASLNRCVIPSVTKKEIKKNADGTFTARYIAIDPNSIRTSYKKPEKDGPVTYIGYMSYNESEYHCTAATKAEAEKGNFAPRNTKMLTELIKFMNGKWTY